MSLRLATLPPPNPNELLVVVGPTASGKTELAIRLAERFGGEVVGADSVQIYRSSTSARASRAPPTGRVPHHLVDIADPLDPFDAQRFVVVAEASIAQVRARGARSNRLWRNLSLGRGPSFAVSRPCPRATPGIARPSRRRVERRRTGRLHREPGRRRPRERRAPFAQQRGPREPGPRRFELSGKPDSAWFAEQASERTATSPASWG